MKILFIIFAVLLSCSSGDDSITLPPVEQEDQYFDVTLAWDKNSEPFVIGYAIYYRNSISDNYIWKTSVNEDQLSVKLNFKKDFIDWYFVATAYSVDDESDYSDEVKYTP